MSEMPSIDVEVFSIDPSSPEDSPETFDGIVTMPSLFSMEDEVVDDLGSLTSEEMMLPIGEEEPKEAVMSLKEGSRGAEKTLAALNSNPRRLVTPKLEPVSFASLHNIESLAADTNVASSSNTDSQDSNCRALDYDGGYGVAVTSEHNNKENEGARQLPLAMRTPAARTSPSSRTEKANRTAQGTERKRPGRKRLELPSEEEVHSITDPIMKKRLQNRKASRECRARKADYLGGMEERVRALESKNAELSFKYNQVVEERALAQKENAMLRIRLDQIEQHFKNMNLSHVSEIAVC